ncbi:aldo/keto reductase [Hymenobacter mucosus]|uniref:Predicted oxidoreductase n=1 Tax=Hymenobacter mucosus TaxID=1411120 RepID=A0A238ZQ40_9BACT|nr:aldo/keto reductase [Hymenobacter mucosus]SNR85485.1 Predicted oxidoreductase [Hymenobacter mucosus]
MDYRPLGTTGLHVSALSLGASSLGGVFHNIDENKGIDTVCTAVEQGINFIDVSPYYGFLKAEQVLGRALRQIPREQYYLSTKVGRYGQDGVKSWDYSGSRAIRSVEESLARLHVDYIDLINVHDIEFSDLQQVINETLPALHSLKEAGVVKHVGITGLPLALFQQVIDQTPAGTVETVLSFCHYCLNDTTLADYVEYLKAHNVGIINASPLAMGMLSERGAPEWHPASVELKQYARQAAAFCMSQGYPIEKLAIQFAVSHPSIATTLVSTARPEAIRQNIAWATEPIDTELLERVQQILQPVMSETWENS